MRKTINFNSNWSFALKRGFAPCTKEEAEQMAFCPVTLPHDWAITSPYAKEMTGGGSQGYLDRWGIGWYRKQFTLHETEGRCFVLHFGGIMENSTVWVNDICVGGRKYGYSTFELDITDAVRKGENSILVKVDNTAAPACRWYSGAGIYRNVQLLILPKQHLVKDEIRIESTVAGESARVTVFPGVASETAVDIAGVHAEGVGEITLEIPKVKLWSAEEPNLYEVTVSLLSSGDAVTEWIGFKSVTIDPGKGLFVNGEPVNLKGVCLHQDGGCYGTAVHPEIWRVRLQELKKIGCNALRLAHHLYSEEFLDLCDELGFYVYEEALDKWTGGAYRRYYETEWKKDIETMVKRDRNRPSILIWGVGNEVENQAHDGMLAMLKNHVDAVKALDPTRPVSLAMNPHFSYPDAAIDLSKVTNIQEYVDEMKKGEIEDIPGRLACIRKIADIVDVLSCNYQEQWYEYIHETCPDKAILGTETYMYFRGLEEKFQNFLDVNPWFDVEEKSYVIGGMLWTGFDYLGEAMGYPAKGWSGALISEDNEWRPIAYLYQSLWNPKEPMIHFAVQDYSIPDVGAKEHWDYPRFESHWEFPQFDKAVVPYMVATTCEEIEITLENERAGRGMGKTFLIPPVKTFPNRTVTGYLPYFAGTMTIIGKNGGVEVLRKVVKTPGPAVKLAFEEEETTVTLNREEIDDLGTTAPVPYQKLMKVRVYDREDLPVFRESAQVHFLVEGPAVLTAVENGDIKKSEPYSEDRIHLFNGKADAALTITGPGRIKVTAFAGGLFSAQAVIVAE